MDLPEEIWAQIISRKSGAWDYRDLVRIQTVSKRFFALSEKLFLTRQSLVLSVKVEELDHILFSIDDTHYVIREETLNLKPIAQLLRRFPGLTTLTIDSKVDTYAGTVFDEGIKSFWKQIGKQLFHCFDPSVRFVKLNMWNEYWGLNLVSFFVAKYADSLKALDLSIETPEDVDVDLLWSSIELCSNLQVLAYENAADPDSLNDDMLHDALEGKKEMRELTLWGLDDVTLDGVSVALRSLNCGSNLKIFRLAMNLTIQRFVNRYLELSAELGDSGPLATVEVFVYRSTATLNGDIRPSTFFQLFPAINEIRIVGPKNFVEPALLVHSFLQLYHDSRENRTLRICCHPKFDPTKKSSRWDFRNAITSYVVFDNVIYPSSPKNLCEKSDLWDLNTRIEIKRGRANVLFDTSFEGTEPLWPHGIRFRSEPIGFKDNSCDSKNCLICHN